MDADQFWPKIGDIYNLLHHNESEKFMVIDILRERPCDRYLVRSRNTGLPKKDFRHELFILEPVKPINPASIAKKQVEQTETLLSLTDENLWDFFEPWTDYEDNQPQESQDDNRQDQEDTAEATTSDLDEDALDKIDSDDRSDGSISGERWAMNKFTEWQERRNLRIDLGNVDPTELAKHLRKFYAEIRTKDRYYAPSSLGGIRAGIHRTLRAPPYNRTVNIIEDNEFVKSNQMLENMCKLYVKSASEKQTHFPAIEEGDIHKLATYLKRYEESPENLLHTFWFLLCYLFARRGREGFRQMKKSTFVVKVDDKGHEYLVMATTEQTKNWRGSSSSNAWDYSDVRAYGIAFDKENTLNVVYVFRFYLKKLNPNNGALFQKPKDVNWQGSDTWYHKTVIGVNKIGDIMKTISKSGFVKGVHKSFGKGDIYFSHVPRWN